MRPLLAASLIALEAPATPAPLDLACPDGVKQQLDGLYRWQVQRMDQPDALAAALSSQLDRFTPELFKLLLQARQLSPTRDGRYLDFDVFSDTQVRTFGAVVSGGGRAGRATPTSQRHPPTVDLQLDAQLHRPVANQRNHLPQ
ncbi:MAG: hypothetical protein VKJ63_03290 [Synechococcus sp.]|nr:hypothetical protein [Synechococcus sp.]